MGNILITQEGAETNTIQENRRNESVYNFYMMLGEALYADDSCFMTEAAYQHTYSYGDHFPAFVNLSWDEFSQKDSLKGIDLNTYNFITSSYRTIPKCIKDEREFEQQNMPKGKGGFEHSDSPEDFLCNISRWKEWHCNYLTSHPEKIKWKEHSPFLPNVNAVYEILKKEILEYIRRKHKDRINKATDVEQERKKILDEMLANKKYCIDKNGSQTKKENAIALLFHDIIMRSLSQHDLITYCKDIGGNICQKNYYQYEKQLSTDESRACSNLREIYSIVKNKEKQYISLDFHKGMFEFHDGRGRHLGEFLFDGTMNKKAEINHNFKTIQ